MKNNIKTLFISLICASLILLATPIAAKEVEPTDINPITQTEEDRISETTPTEQKKELTFDGLVDKPLGDEENITGSQGAEESNIFTLIYDSAVAHAAEIFSFLSLIGTVIISYLYKKGLIPSVKSALSTMGTAVGSIKESSDKQCQEQKLSQENINRRLAEFEQAFLKYEKTLREMESRLIAENEVYTQIERSNMLLSSQIDMLYDIFMTSSLPQYQKEATGQRINKMRKELEDYEAVQKP